jgi:toxin ParE1/3/4
VAIRTTLEAERDIYRLFELGVRDYGFAAADRYATDLREALHGLSANPYMVRERHETGRPVRLYRFRAHHILYTIDNEDVLVLRVLSNRQDWLHQL